MISSPTLSFHHSRRTRIWDQFDSISARYEWNKYRRTSRPHPTTTTKNPSRPPFVFWSRTSSFKQPSVSKRKKKKLWKRYKKCEDFFFFACDFNPKQTKKDGSDFVITRACASPASRSKCPWKFVQLYVCMFLCSVRILSARINATEQMRCTESTL